MKRMQQAELFYKNNMHQSNETQTQSKIKKSLFSVRSNCVKKGLKKIIRGRKHQKKRLKKTKWGRMFLSKKRIFLEKKFLRLKGISTENKCRQTQGKNRSTIHVQSTHNNTIYTVSRGGGETDYLVSTGMCGFKNSRKSTSYASQMAAEKCAGFLLKRNAKRHKYYVQIKGLGAGKLSGVRALHHQGIRLINIEECTGLPHNGCRAPRRRRF